jgi:hypothetical protein
LTNVTVAIPRQDYQKGLLSPYHAAVHWLRASLRKFLP